MIPFSTAEEDLLLGTRFGVHLKVEVEKSSSTAQYHDLTSLVGSNWVDGVSIRQDVDRLVGQADVSLLREVSSSQSICPLRTGSTVNQSSSGGPSLVIDVTREAKISVAQIAASCSPVSTDYHLLLRGEIDEWDARETPMRLSVRDPGGFLMDRFIETETQYGTTSGDAIESVMQSILDDALGSTDVEVQASSTPGFLITPYTQEQMPIMDALTGLAGLIGWDLRYKWSSGDDDYTLQFYPPDRTSTTPDSTFGPDRYAAVPRLAINRADIRNVVEVRYPSSTSDRTETVTASDTSSIDKYGRRWMRIVEGPDSPIDTEAEAGVLANAALSDLAEPDVEQEINMHLFWPVEINDLHRWEQNAVHYGQDQDLAVTGFRHEIWRDRARTIISARSNARSATKRWLFRPSTDVELPEITSVFLDFDNDSGVVNMHVTLNEAAFGLKYATGSTDYPTLAVVQATTAVAAVLHTLSVEPLDTLTGSESLFLRVVAYENFDGSGRESKLSWIRRATRIAVPPALSGVSHVGFDDSTDINWQVNWTIFGDISSSQHDVAVEYFKEVNLLETQTGILVTSTMPHLRTTTGGGSTVGTQGRVRVILNESTGGVLSSYDTLLDDFTF